ncbi:hypothetical protein CFOL_v3_02893 [Cephalotus follicularis]|uniref:Retrovirus-related Pol polyprotein from transposon TNT 1-94-like beta-barrel domain-containing protein n=1 Tax=Cephalotus follicularis TaxID=3775 RepID=A0A1Q3AUV1_CEPFO|nr:hypothetical protein CFOL_v3_02893 [Cephalotus follicularis]
MYKGNQKKGGNFNPGNQRYSKSVDAVKRPMVNASVTDSISNISADSSSSMIPEHSTSQLTFTLDQYQQILKLLSKDVSSAEPTANMAGIFAGLMNVCSGDDWIIDSGSNDHMTGNFNSLNIYKPSMSCHANVKLPNGSTTKITHVGTTKLSNTLTLHNVLFVPVFSFSLLSISRFTKENQCFVIFYPDFCLFQDLWTDRIMGIGRVKQRLYYLVPHTLCHISTATSFHSVAPVSTQVFFFTSYSRK